MPSTFRPSFGRVLLAACLATLAVPFGALGATVVDGDAYSTTVDVGGGKLKTSLSSQPINYQTDSGSWKSIDTTLEQSANGDAHPQSVDGDVTIPDSLTQPIELEHDRHVATFRLLGADGAADVDGDSASFSDALSHVDASYVARPDGVKETLLLASASAAHTFVYDLKAGAGWSAAVEGGDVVLRDSSDTERYRISAPLAWDSAADPAYTNALALSVSKLADGHWHVTLRPDAAWLSDPTRVYPVSIDPDFSWANGTTHFHGAQDCYLASLQQANYTFCAAAYLTTGYYNRAYNSLLKFDIASAIPSNATVTGATFKAYAPPASPKAAAPHSLYTVTSDWDSTATWNNRKTGIPWTTAGGDISSNPAYKSSATSVSTNPAWYSWTAPTATVQGWVNGTLPNYGFMLKMDSAPGCCSYVFASTEASMSSQFPADSTQWPTLDVTWSQADSTPPPAPDSLSLIDVDGLLAQATLGFNAPDDVAGSGGTASGLDHSEYRFGVNGGAKGAWTSTTDTEVDLSGVNPGDTLDVDVRDIDVAGNVSSTTSATLSVWSEENPPSDDAAAADFASRFGVSQTVAAAWLGTEDKAHELRSELEDLADASNIAGYWFDNSARKVHVQVLDTSSSGQIQARASDLGILGDLVIDVVPYTEDHLVAQNQAAAGPLTDLIQSGQLLMSADSVNSRLVWDVSDTVTSAQLASIQAAALTTDPHAVVQAGTGSANGTPDKASCVAWPDDPLDFSGDTARAWAGCKGAFRGGLGIRSLLGIDAQGVKTWAECSSGFNAVRFSDGAPMMLTAGHCFDPTGLNAKWQMRSNDPDDDAKDQTIGNNAIATNGPEDDYPSSKADAGAVRYSSPPDVVSPIVFDRGGKQHPAKGKAFTGGTPRLPVRQVDEPSIPGDQACVYGGRTGKFCGTVIARKGTNNEMLWLNTCDARHGDSGAAVLQGKRAVGMLQSTYDKNNAGIIQDAEDSLAKVSPTEALVANCDGTGHKGFDVATDILADQRVTKTRVLTYKWHKSFTSPKTNTQAWVRAVATWDTKVNVDLHVWNTTGGSDLTQGHISTSGTTSFTDGYVSADVKKFGPEQFVETGADATRNYAFGVCYVGATAGIDHKTKVSITFVDRSGASSTQSVTLAGQGDAAVVRAPGTSTRPEVTSSTSSSWCHGASKASTSAPTMITAPTITGCNTTQGNCVLTPGAWSSGTVLSYMDDYCSSSGGPYVDCPHDAYTTDAPTIYSRWTDGGCGLEWVATVVASNTFGTVYYPVRMHQYVGCAE